ncbi:MAG: tyrosine-protein phosphatase [Eubacteriales bacterium]|nr:tyrosine-protein phosphatase [Eubacteriales bacterium]
MNIENLRDLGGLKSKDGRSIRHGLLIRSASLFNISDSDAAELTDVLHLKTIIDLRSDLERSEKPDKEIKGVSNIHIPIFSDTVLGISRDSISLEKLGQTMWLDMAMLYRGMVDHPMAVRGFANVLYKVMNHPDDGAVLWHCSAGKDRCGMVSVLVEHMLGIDRETIFADYMETNKTAISFADSAFRSFIAKGVPEEAAYKIRSLYVADEAYLEAALSEMETLYGGPDGFIHKALKISDENIEKFRNKCLL